MTARRVAECLLYCTVCAQIAVENRAARAVGKAAWSAVGRVNECDLLPVSCCDYWSVTLLSAQEMREKTDCDRPFGGFANDDVLRHCVVRQRWAHVAQQHSLRAITLRREACSVCMVK